MTRLDEIEARANAATEGPWEADGLEGIITSKTDGLVTDPQGPYLVVDGITMWAEPDAEFIAHARQDVPALVAALRGVIELHRIIRVGGAGGNIYEVCQTCNQTAPCAYVRTIHQHLGEDA